MNHSDVKQLIKSKGFVYANVNGSNKGMVALVRPDSQKVEYVSNTVLGWLQHLNDVVIPKESFLNHYVGDRVQVFTIEKEYRYWGAFGRISDVVGKQVNVHVEMGEGLDIDTITISRSDVVVLEREGVVDLRNMTPEERDAVIMQMQGITKERNEIADMPFVCECKEPTCEQTINAEEWHRLDDGRNPDNSVIVHKSCLFTNIRPEKINQWTGNLVLLDIS